MFFLQRQARGEGVLFFLSASSSGIANIIYMVAGIIYSEKIVRSGIHSTSVIASRDLPVSALEIAKRPV